MLWIRSWATGLVIAVVVLIMNMSSTPLKALSAYFAGPLLPGFLILETLPQQGPPIGWGWVIVAGIPPIISGSIIYGLIVYLFLRVLGKTQFGKASAGNGS